MNWLTVVLVYLLKIRNEEDGLNVQKVFFLENNFWCETHEHFKSDEEYLYKVGVDSERTAHNTFKCVYNQETSYFLKSTNLDYVVLNNSVVKDINSFLLKSSKDDKFSLRFGFFFADKPIRSCCYFASYKVNVHNYVTYKLLEKVPENKNSLRLRSNVTDHIEHIKDRFENFILMNPLRFNEYIKILNKKTTKDKLIKIEEAANFNLYYFKNHSECLESLKNFIEDLCYFKLLKDDEITDSFTSKRWNDKTTTLKVSEFRENLYKKFLENFESIEINENWKLLFDKCFNFVKNEILKNRIFLPIGGKYNIDCCIGLISNLICELVKQKHKKYTVAIPKYKCFISSKMINSLCTGLKNLQVRIFKDLSESEYIPKHFFRKEIETLEVETLDNYINVERMVCDYYNMFVYIFNLYFGLNKYSRVSYTYVSPIFIDNYNLMIVDGIGFKISEYFGQINGFDDKGEEIAMMKGIDYFIQNSILYLPSKVLKMKNIQEIEEISLDPKRNDQRIKINKYLSI